MPADEMYNVKHSISFAGSLRGRVSLSSRASNGFWATARHVFGLLIRLFHLP